MATYNNTMRVTLIASVALSSFVSVADAFFVSTTPRTRRIGTISIASDVVVGPLRASDFGGSDFASAMPEKPELTFREKLAESATRFTDEIESRLDEGVPPPPELEELRTARDDPDVGPAELALRVYALMIEKGMTYDVHPETGTLSPTEFDIQSNLDVPEVKQEFAYLYEYGMNLIRKGVVGVDTVKEEVLNRLIARTGFSPEEFDKWLGY